MRDVFSIGTGHVPVTKRRECPGAAHGGARAIKSALAEAWLEQREVTAMPCSCRGTWLIARQNSSEGRRFSSMIAARQSREASEYTYVFQSMATWSGFWPGRGAG